MCIKNWLKFPNCLGKKFQKTQGVIFLTHTVEIRRTWGWSILYSPLWLELRTCTQRSNSSSNANCFRNAAQSPFFPSGVPAVHHLFLPSFFLASIPFSLMPSPFHCHFSLFSCSSRCPFRFPSFLLSLSAPVLMFTRSGWIFSIAGDRLVYV